MWCRHCQQDVPAVARGASGPLVCPRCESDLPVVAAIPSATIDSSTSGSKLSDAGVPLDSYDEVKRESPPSIDVLSVDDLGQQLRRIGRKLGPARKETLTAANRFPAVAKAARIDWTHAPTFVPDSSAAELSALSYRTHREPAPSRRTTGTWLVGLLLFFGLVGLASGGGLLAWSVLAQFGPAWQWGTTTMIASQGMLIAGLVWMASRLWRNSRRVNRQLQGIDRQLAEIQHQSGFESETWSTRSGAYFDHFARGASSQLLLANLRGQLDQLSARIMSQHR